MHHNCTLALIGVYQHVKALVETGPVSHPSGKQHALQLQFRFYETLQKSWMCAMQKKMKTKMQLLMKHISNCLYK